MCAFLFLVLFVLRLWRNACLDNFYRTISFEFLRYTGYLYLVRYFLSFFKLNLCTIGCIHGYEENSEVHIIAFSVFAFTGDIFMTLFTKHPCLQQCLEPFFPCVFPSSCIVWDFWCIFELIFLCGAIQISGFIYFFLLK